MAFKLILAVAVCIASANAAISRDAFGPFRYKCSSAQICTPLPNCDFNGMISPSAVRLTAEEEELRAPLVPCRIKSGGDGYCCTDPNYKDDWPANYVDPGLPKPIKRDEAVTRPPPPPAPTTARPKPRGKPAQAAVVNTGCPERNRTALPDLNPGAWKKGDFHSGYGEFLWQAAIVDPSHKFLCGCYLTDQFTCTTTATCVKQFLSNPSKIHVAIGVYDLTQYNNVEPGGGEKYAQFSEVEEVILDPKGRDVALVTMNIKKDPVEYNYYTAPICIDLPEGLRTADYDNCVITGWGTDKKTPHWYDVKLLSESECKTLVKNFNPKIQSCAVADVDICDQVEFGNGMQCRYRGDRYDQDVRDVYWLRGVFNDRVCTAGKNVIVYTHLDMDWIDKLLKKRQDEVAALN